MDVNSAFLNCDLEEEIYMAQHEGCVVFGQEKQGKQLNHITLINLRLWNEFGFPIVQFLSSVPTQKLALSNIL